MAAGISECSNQSDIRADKKVSANSHHCFLFSASAGDVPLLHCFVVTDIRILWNIADIVMMKGYLSGY
jgi:hypothetical protein